MTRQTLALVTLIAATFFSQQSFGYYSPQMGKWLSRDPQHDVHIAINGKVKLAEMNQAETLYVFTKNKSCNAVDPIGLQLYVCTRPAHFPFPFGYHAYLWDSTGKNKPCGMGGSSGSGPTGNPGDNGPRSKDTVCTPVENSDGQVADDVMNCCKNSANDGPWCLGFNDCHNKVDRCLKKYCLIPPKHSRWHQQDDPDAPEPVSPTYPSTGGIQIIAF